MNAPDKIYLQVCGECQEEDCKNCKFEDLEDNITWCKDRIYKKDIEYIRKDALLEWAKAYKEEADASARSRTDNLSWGESVAMRAVIDKIESL